MDLEAGVRIGSLCADGGPRDAVACPIAADVMKQLHAAVGDEPPEAALCIFTSLTEAYVEGHVLFMHEALRRSPMLREGALPLYVLDQALSPRGRARVTTVYGPTRWVERARERAKDASSVTKFALNKEKIALFGLRAACGSVLKLDTGDMLPLSDLSPMLTELSRRAASLPAHASLQAKQPPLPLPLPVWATQALGQPEGRINGGLMLFPRFWLHNATQSALARRAERESREQSLLGDFFGSELRMLPKRYNVEMRLWDAAHAEWRSAYARAAAGTEDMLPPDVTAVDSHAGATQAVLLHYVGRDKPWMRYDRSRSADTQADLCRRLREKDEETCTRYLRTQMLWWRAFAAGRCLIVGDAARGKGQGFVVDAFEQVLRMHQPTLPPRDVGNNATGTRCVDAADCVRAATALDCHAPSADEQWREATLLSLGREKGLAAGVRTLLEDVYQPKVGVFGGPAVARTT
jgi:hypothetical protein